MLSVALAPLGFGSRAVPRHETMRAQQCTMVQSWYDAGSRIGSSPPKERVRAHGPSASLCLHCPTLPPSLRHRCAPLHSTLPYR